jgi:hypothetical protein
LGSLFVFSPAHADLTTGLVAHWSFDDCTAKDMSGNGNDGLIEGMPICVDGVKGKAFNFNGDVIRTAGYLNQVIKEKTLVAWVKLNDLEQQAGGIATIATDLKEKDNFDSIVYAEKSKYHWFMGSTGFTRSYDTTLTENSSSWILMTITYADNNYKIYRNGVLIGTTTSYVTSTYDVNSLFFVGKRHLMDCATTNVCVNAVIDEARLYNRALSETEIKALYSETQGISGNINGVQKYSTVCKNTKTSVTKKIAMADGAKEWNCKTAGLQTKKGDIVTVTITGVSQ